MKSQYPGSPVTYQNSEPQTYLQNYDRIQQISRENAEIIKSYFKPAKEETYNDVSISLDKEEDDSISSFFYAQSFTPTEED